MFIRSSIKYKEKRKITAHAYLFNQSMSYFFKFLMKPSNEDNNIIKNTTKILLARKFNRLSRLTIASPLYEGKEVFYINIWRCYY